jgi:hypothetical protein
MAFKPKSDTYNRIFNLQEVGFDEQQFVEAIFQDEYLLVIGSEVILNKEIEPTGDISNYILKVINGNSNNFKDYNELESKSDNNVDVVRNLLNSNEFCYDIADMSIELRDLLKTKVFRFVLTTTFDFYLETLMRQIWGDELRVVNINDDASLKAIRKELTSFREGEKYLHPTLFYIFGKAVKDESKKFVKTDDDAIQIIDKWIKFGDEDPILKFMRSKRLLALGCKFDNWYFRFFWYILRRDKGTDDGKRMLKPGEVAITFIENDRSDKKLENYLQRSRIFVHGEARHFMRNLTMKITSPEFNDVFAERLSDYRRSGGVFLSYCSKDIVIAKKIFYQLHDRYDVWFDNSSLHGGDNYDHKIEEAIAAARIFIPILTPHIAEDLNEGKTDNYYNQEWRMASQLADKAIIPLAVNGYDLRQPYHTETFESIIHGAISGINLMNDQFEKLRSSIDEHLKEQ